MTTDDIVKAFATELRAAKARANMTNREIAEGYGASKSSVSAMIVNPGGARFADLVRLIRVLGANPADVWKAAFEEARREQRWLELTGEANS